MQQTKRRPVDVLLEKYSASHQNPVNDLIHFVCVPAIMFSLLGMLWTFHPFAAIGMVVASHVYYCMLSVQLMCGMLAMSCAMLGALHALPQDLVFPLSAIVFVLAWIGQFIGHKIEGKKPSFLEDLRFLLIGPLFVLGFLYRRLRIKY